MTNAIIILILVFIIGFATSYIIYKKKKGKKCIGCPAGCTDSESCTCRHKS